MLSIFLSVLEKLTIAFELYPIFEFFVVLIALVDASRKYNEISLVHFLD